MTLLKIACKACKDATGANSNSAFKATVGGRDKNFMKIKKHSMKRKKLNHSYFEYNNNKNNI